MQNPSEEKFRRINLTNAAIQSRVASLPSSMAFFELLGFQVNSVIIQYQIVQRDLYAKPYAGSLQR